MAVRVLILRAPGINRDEDAVAAIELAGGVAERVHVNRLVEGSVRLRDYAMLVIPGGFSYGDHLGAGKLLAVDIAHRLGEQIRDFVADGRPVIGICNGFQVLVKSGVLPGVEPPQSGVEEPLATLAANAGGSFECRWVELVAEPTSRCAFTRSIERPIAVPVAHGEGRFVVRDAATLAVLKASGQIALRYSATSYPANPNGSDDDIAGVCNPQGNVLGLMPHPEDAILPTQHPTWTRDAPRSEGDGLVIFRNAVRYAARD